MTTHFYSDPHFGHHNIIEFCKRPFTSTAEMNFILQEQLEFLIPWG